MDFDQDKKIIVKHGSIVKSRNTDRPRYIRPVERQRMRPWLIEHLDKNDITGLVWQARRDKVFRISWKHAANQCFNLQKDTNLFECWAIHTGRHQDSDHKRWKANFRCALNSLPDVIELKEQGIKKGNNAFKVYRFLDDRETKANKEGKPRKKKEKLDYDYENELKLSEEYYEQSYTEDEAGTSTEDQQDFGNLQTSHLSNLRQINSTKISGVDLLIEADNKEMLEPINDVDNLHEILAAATASLAAGGDALALEKISIEQLSRLGEVSKMKLDIRQNDEKGETSGLRYVFLCKWCEKVFQAKVDLFQHFLVMHQDKLLSGEEYGMARTLFACSQVQSLEKEIADLEQKVLNFTRETFQPSSDEVIEDGQVVDQVTNSQSSVPSFVEDQAMDLTIGNLESIVPKEDEALDLSINSTRQDLDKTVLFQKLNNKIKLRSAQSKPVNKRRRSSNVDVDYTGKFGNYGLAGAPRTKRQMSLLLKKKEEEEKIKKNADTAKQHSKEDLVHAEILISLKCAAGEENDNDSKEDNYEETGGCDIDEKGDNKGSEKKHVRKIFYLITESEKEGKEGDLILIDTANIDVKEEHGTETKGLDEDINKDNIKEKFRSDADAKRNVLDKSNVAKLKQVALLKEDESKESYALQNNITDVLEDKELNSSGERSRLNEETDCLEGECYQKNVEELNLKAYKCGICLQTFSVDRELFQHVLTHKMGFLCKICGDRFEHLEEIEVHMMNHMSHAPFELKCNACLEYFSNKTESESHKCDLVKIVNNATDNVTKSYQQLLVEEKDHEGKQNLEYGERSKRVVVKEGVNGDIHTVAEGNIALSTTAINSLASGNLTSEQIKIRACDGKDICDIEPTTIIGNIFNKKSVIAENENPFELVLPYQVAREKAELQDMFVTVDDNHECVRLKDDESTSSVFEIGQSVMYLNGQNNETGIIGAFVQQTGEKSKDEIEMSDGQTDGQKANNIEVITTKLYQALSEDGKKSQDLCHISAVTEIVTDVDKFLIKSEKLENDNKKEDDIKGLENQIKQLSKIVATSSTNRLGIIVYGICGNRQIPDQIQTHLPEHVELKNEELLESSKECVICNTNVGIEELNNHLKSHSVYELSRAQNVCESQNLIDGKEKKSAREPELFKIKLFVCGLCNLHFESIQALKEHVIDHSASLKVVETDKSVILQHGIKRKSDATMADNVAKRRGKNIQCDLNEASLKINQKEDFAETNKMQHDFGENVTECKVKVMEGERKNVSMLAAALQSAPNFNFVSLMQSGNQKTGVSAQVLGQPMKSGTNFKPLSMEPWGADLEQKIINVSPKLKQITVKKIADANVYVRNEGPKDQKKKSVDQNFSVQDVSEAQYVSRESVSQNACSQPSESTSVATPVSVFSAVSKLSAASSVSIATATNKQNAPISVAESNKLTSNSSVSYSVGVLPDGISAILFKSADQSLLKDLSFRMPESSGAGKGVTVKIPVCVTADLQASGKLMSLAQSSLASKSDVAGSKIQPVAVPIKIGSLKRSVTSEAKGTLTHPRGLVTVVGIENKARVPSQVIVGTDTPSTVMNDVKIQIGKSLLSMVHPESTSGTCVQSPVIGTQKIALNSNAVHLDLKSSAASVSSPQTLPHVQTIPIGALLKSLPVTSKTDVGKRNLTTPVNLLSSVTSHAQGNSSYHMNLMRTILTPPRSSADVAGQTVKRTLSCLSSSNMISNLDLGNISQQSLMSCPVSINASDKPMTCAPLSMKLASVKAKTSVSVPMQVTTLATRILGTVPTDLDCQKHKIAVATMVTSSNISPKLHANTVSCSPKQLNTGFGRGSLPLVSNVSSQPLHLSLDTVMGHQLPVAMGTDIPMEKQHHLLNLIKLIPPPVVTQVHASTVMTMSSAAQQTSNSTSLPTSSQCIMKPSVIQSGKQAPKPTFSLMVTSTSVGMQQMSSTVICTNAETQGDVHTKDTDLKWTTNSLSAMPQLKVMCNICKKMLNGYEEMTKHVCYKPDNMHECEMLKYPLQSTDTVAVHVCATTSEDANKVNKTEDGGNKVTLFPCIKCKQLFTGCTEFYKHTKDHHAYTQTTNTCTDAEGSPLETTGEENEIFKQTLPNQAKVSQHATCSYMCSQCPKIFSEESSVIQFENSHNSQTYSCTEVHCKDSFTSKERLEFHFLTEHAFECLICSYRCKSLEQIESHVLEHCLQEVSLSFYECIECQQCLVTLQAFKDHCKAMHPNANPDVYRDKNHVWYRCKPCIINFWSKSLLVDHIKYVHWKKRDYSCGVCKTLFNYAKLNKVLEHLQGHTSRRTVNVYVDLQVCRSCMMIFPSMMTYSQHMLCFKHRKRSISLIDSGEFCNKTDASKEKKCVTDISETKFDRCTASKVVNTEALEIDENKTLGSEGSKTDAANEKNIKTEAITFKNKDDTDELKYTGEIDIDAEREQVASFIIPSVKEEQDKRVINEVLGSGSDSFSNNIEICNGKTKSDKDNNISDKDETVSKDKQPQITQRDLDKFSANVRQMTCSQCGLNFTSLFQLKQHKVMRHIYSHTQPFKCNPKKRKMRYLVNDGKKSG